MPERDSALDERPPEDGRGCVVGSAGGGLDDMERPQPTLTVALACTRPQSSNQGLMKQRLDMTHANRFISVR